MTSTDRLVSAGAAAAVGATTFIPLPLVDDWLASLSRRQMVARILRRHRRHFPTGDVSPLYNDGGSIFGLPFRFAKSVALWPVKKVLRKVIFVFAIRDVAMAVGRTLALAHTLDRALGYGAFRDDATRAARTDEARRLKKALDTAWSGIDRRLVQRAATAVLDRARKREDRVEELEGFLEELDRKVDQALAGISP